MDKEQLEAGLAPFFARCKEEGHEIADYCLEIAFPGVTNSPWTLRVKASRFQGMDCFDIIYRLSVYINETTTEEVNSSIFTIDVIDENEDIKCSSYREPEVTTKPKREPVPEPKEARELDERI